MLCQIVLQYLKYHFLFKKVGQKLVKAFSKNIKPIGIPMGSALYVTIRTQSFRVVSRYSRTLRGSRVRPR